MALNAGSSALADLPLIRGSALRSSARHAQVAPGTEVNHQLIPVLPGLAGVLGEPGLRAGASYLIESSLSLALALMAQVSREGAWAAAIGLPDLGAQAAAGLGIDLDRLALIPEPGHAWLEVLSTVADAVDVVAIRPPHRPADQAVRRIAARMRQRGSTLLVLGEHWPGAFMRLSVTDSVWSGMRPDGHGHLAARHAQVTRVGKSGTDAQRMWLPAADGSVRPYAEPPTLRVVP
ncbi:hypothetical protein EK0264_15325 [Epidermidibacterium keratini]|uniref:Recombinase A n=1 Tax=Epidermidibacterium keratini TaxID=1891644 RepID=A0A7L4YRF0_9ACTN|nr:hypothetical protein [Epidermidibacterium keratini]QHC01523.1 hypothetical protein EK0264_15325 [Epidermidibacterium keratini]